MGTGKKKIEIKKIDDSSRRMVTFSKRRHGLFKKAREFCRIELTRFFAVVFSPKGNIFQDGDQTLIQRYLSTRQPNGGAIDLNAAAAAAIVVDRFDLMSIIRANDNNRVAAAEDSEIAIRGGLLFSKNNASSRVRIHEVEDLSELERLKNNLDEERRRIIQMLDAIHGTRGTTAKAKPQLGHGV